MTSESMFRIETQVTQSMQQPKLQSLATVQQADEQAYYQQQSVAAGKTKRLMLLETEKDSGTKKMPSIISLPKDQMAKLIKSQSKSNNDNISNMQKLSAEEDDHPETMIPTTEHETVTGTEDKAMNNSNAPRNNMEKKKNKKKRKVDEIIPSEEQEAEDNNKDDMEVTTTLTNDDDVREERTEDVSHEKKKDHKKKKNKK